MIIRPEWTLRESGPGELLENRLPEKLRRILYQSASGNIGQLAALAIRQIADSLYVLKMTSLFPLLDARLVGPHTYGVHLLERQATPLSLGWIPYPGPGSLDV
jgi:hypothetical protein